MPALTAAEREFLANPWRFIEQTDASTKANHPGSREIEIPTAFVTVAGAIAAMTIIADQLIGTKRQIVATIDGVPALSFKGRPPTVRVHHARFGGQLVAGLLMLCERADKDHGANKTTLYLSGDQ